MILVCPACDAKFKIPDGAIPASGRKVRCAKCKHSWHAVPQQIVKALAAAAAPPPRPQSAPSAAFPPPEEIDAGAAARASAIRQSVQGFDDAASPAPPPLADEDRDMFDEDGAPEPKVAAPGDEFDEDHGATDHGSSEFDGDDFGVGAVAKEHMGTEFSLDDDDDHEGGDDDSEEDYDAGDFVARRRAEQRREAERKAQARKRQLLVVGWALLVVMWLTILGGLVFMQDTVVKTFPGMVGFYEIFEGASDVERFRPEDGEPLTTPLTEREIYLTAKLYNDRTRVETVDGNPVLMVRGFVENPSATEFGRTASVPQVRVDVLDRSGNVLETVITDPEGFAIRRGARIDFETSIYPVPPGAANVSVKVLEGTRSRVVRSTG
ncbi:zinc-ribbon domain-containing protein [Kordiimonas lipolytica]|uniref:Zinc-ribbon domain-containing protein n=1 Tax=Kordiimonas lipolytica TaxID=1662421 RepID=A0ABV8UDW4_9PROT|nr:zinc-ribbon domain-containing protein [Kordiimonas lipolytica]